MPLAVDTARQVVQWIGMVGKAEMVVSRHRGRAFHLSVIPRTRRLSSRRMATNPHLRDTDFSGVATAPADTPSSPDLADRPSTWYAANHCLSVYRSDVQ